MIIVDCGFKGGNQKMTTVMKFEENLSVFQNIVVLTRSEDGKLFIGNTYFYNGRGTADDWMSVMYPDALPEDRGIIMGWNYLDENSPAVTLVPEANAETGVEDFLYAHGMERDWRTVDYHVIKSYPEIEQYFAKNRLEAGKTIAFGIRK